MVSAGEQNPRHQDFQALGLGCRGNEGTWSGLMGTVNFT